MDDRTFFISEVTKPISEAAEDEVAVGKSFFEPLAPSLVVAFKLERKGVEVGVVGLELRRQCLFRRGEVGD